MISPRGQREEGARFLELQTAENQELAAQSSFSANIQIMWKRLTDVSGDYCTAGAWTGLIYRKDQHKRWGGVRSSFLSCRSFIHHLLVSLQLIRSQHEGCRCLLPTLRTFFSLNLVRQVLTNSIWEEVEKLCITCFCLVIRPWIWSCFSFSSHLKSSSFVSHQMEQEDKMSVYPHVLFCLNCLAYFCFLNS